MPVITTFKLRRETLANWNSANPILALGEPGYITDTKELRIGDGVTLFTGLTSISAATGPPIANQYADTVSLIADQGSQVANFMYFVTDASADVRVDSGYAYYEWRGTTVGDITDYNLVNLTSFDWSRQVRRGPVLGESPGGATIAEGLDNIFYGQVDTTSEIISIDPVEVGDSVSPVINGIATGNDGEMQTITLLDDSLSSVGTVAGTPTSGTIQFSQAVTTPITPTDPDTRTYTVRVNTTYDGGSTFEDIDSASIEITEVYPFLSGMAAAGLVQGTMYAALAKTIDIQKNLSAAYTGSSQRVYFAYPSDYPDLISILDNEGVDVLGSLFPSTPALLNVDSTGLTADWTKQYKVYEGTYDISFTSEDIRFFFTSLDISSSDDVPEGSENLYMTQAERSKIGGFPNPGDVGDMIKATYDIDDNGIVDETTSVVVEVYNDTVSTILKGTYVKFTGFDATTAKPTIIAADQSSGDETVGIVLEGILTLGTGKIVTGGIIKGVDTSGTTVGDRIYLSTAGGYTDTKPTSGFVQEVSRVARVDASDGEMIVLFYEREAESIENAINIVFSITGGTVVKTVIGYNTINKLTQVVDYTLPLISGLSDIHYKIFVKNSSGGTFDLLTSGPDTIEGETSIEMLDSESFELYISDEYKIL